MSIITSWFSVVSSLSPGPSSREKPPLPTVWCLGLKGFGGSGFRTEEFRDVGALGVRGLGIELPYATLDREDLQRYL